MDIKVAVVEDNDRVREGLAVLIDGSEGFQCSEAYGTAEEALRRLPVYRPDVVLMDIQLPRMSGIECVGKMKELNPDVQIMMLTVYEEDEKVFKSILAGATGYILKKTPPAELLKAIRELHAGGSPMSDLIARKVIEAFRETRKLSKETEDLSDREMEILSFLARGYRDKEIAEKFFLSAKTIHSHLRNIYQKLHVRTRTQAVLKYLQK